MPAPGMPIRWLSAPPDAVPVRHGRRGRILATVLAVALVCGGSAVAPPTTALEPTASPSAEPSPGAGASPSAEPSPGAGASPSAEPSPSPSPSADPSPGVSASPPAEPSPSPPTELSPTASPSAEPNPSPSADPSPGLGPAAEPSPGLSPAEEPSPTPTPLPPACGSPADVPRADLLLAGIIRVPGFADVMLPADPTWTEDPLHDRNWSFRYHSLTTTVGPLLAAGTSTGDQRYLDRAAFLLADWVADNPRDAPPAPMSWNDHSTALRAIVISCALQALARDQWLLEAAETHAATLSDPAFYVNDGNHAIDQSRGLLSLGCVLHRPEWTSLAATRLGTLVPLAIDPEGVPYEQGFGYWGYNLEVLQEAEAELVGCGLPVPAVFDRLELMDLPLALATLPNGQYETVGDTLRGGARLTGFDGAADWAALLGRAGTRPTTSVRIYPGGYVFARTGWGERRALLDETAVTIRYGPAQWKHGHRDHGAVTIYSYGSRLLVDPGLYAYEIDAWRTYFKGRSAHNAVTVDGLTDDYRKASRLVRSAVSGSRLDVLIDLPFYRGVTSTRRVVMSRELGWVLVDDRGSSSVVRTYRQLWHLVEDGAPTITATGARTHRERGNLQIRQLTSGASIRLVRGATAPIQGWVSPEYRSLVEAPVVEARRTGRAVRFVTLLAPAAGQSDVRVTNVVVTGSTVDFTITIGERSEKVRVTPTASYVRSIP
jgi:hypothetical protein